MIWNGKDIYGEKVNIVVYMYKLSVNGKIKSVQKCLMQNEGGKMKKFFLLILLMMSMMLSAQDDAISIDPAFQSQNFNLFYPTMFDPDNPADQPLLFNLTVTNNGGIEHFIKIDMLWRGNSLLQGGGEIYPINVPNVYHLSNRMIITTGTSQFETNFDAEDIWQNNSEFEELILETGRFPDGEYMFLFQAFESENSDQPISNQATVIITITSPVSISLITPGNPVGLGPSSITDLNPTFVWFSNFTDYTITVFELDNDGSQSTSLEEIELLEPLFSEQVSGTTFPYPTYAERLEFEKTYGWQITADISSPDESLNKTEKSDIYLFTVNSGEQIDVDNQALINFLMQLNSEQTKEAIDLLKTGYFSTNLKYDGNQIETSDLNDILMGYTGNAIRIRSFSIE